MVSIVLGHVKAALFCHLEFLTARPGLGCNKEIGAPVVSVDLILDKDDLASLRPAVIPHPIISEPHIDPAW